MIDDILNDFLLDFHSFTQELIDEDIEGVFMKNGFHKFERNTMIHPLVFEGEDMAKAADMSTQDGVEYMIQITKGLSIFGGR